MWFLATAAFVSVVGEDYLEAFAILVVILLERLDRIFLRAAGGAFHGGVAKARKRSRDGAAGGNVETIAADGLVPGDIVLVDGGDVVTADLRLIEASKLQADEAALTGESIPVEKTSETIDAETPLPGARQHALQGHCGLSRRGCGVVVATGMATELGTISALVDDSMDTGQTPLEKRLDRLGTNLIWLTLAITAVVAITGVLSGRDTLLVIKTSIALAVAAIPEGLPIVATLALARGMFRMAKRNALISRLAAVETLGATDVICTDKTGTLTEGQMTVRTLVTSAHEITVSGGAFDREGRFESGGTELDIQSDRAAIDLSPSWRSL